MSDGLDELDILILGCGYTGQRVAKRFLARGARVTATTRSPERLAGLGAKVISVDDLPRHVRPGMLVLHSIPPTTPPTTQPTIQTTIQPAIQATTQASIQTTIQPAIQATTQAAKQATIQADPPQGLADAGLADAGLADAGSADAGSADGLGLDARLLAVLRDRAKRVVYLSSTAVYGSATLVDETTPVDPSTVQARKRIEAERAIAEGPWSSLILRPAAIYGPGRGVQESMQRGEHSLSERFVSRIHVDDLATHVEAALLSEIGGAYPVADEEPCTSLEIAEFCAKLLGIPVTGGVVDRGGRGATDGGRGAASRVPRFANNRRVDGRAIREALGITLEYPSYRVGVPKALSLVP